MGIKFDWKVHEYSIPEDLKRLGPHLTSQTYSFECQVFEIWVFPLIYSNIIEFP